MADCDLSLATAPKAAEALDDLEVVYSVTASFVVTAGVYNGLVDKANLAALINDRGGVTEDDLGEVRIIEVTHRDRTIARADSAD